MIRSIADLQQMKEAYLEKMGQYTHLCMVCYGTGCMSSGCKNVRDAMVEELEKAGLSDKVAVIERGCMGTCAVGPVVYVLPDETYYTEMTPERVKDVVQKHFIGGEPVTEYTFYDSIQKKRVSNIHDVAFFRDQVRIALRNCGLIDVNCINSYVSKDGYLALARILEKGDRMAVIEELKRSGLRGRGGAGFPAGVKWEAAYHEPGEEKYIICNADEGDPGAFMDRAVIESDPHTLIEGMLIGAYAIGASDMYVYIRAEYPLAVERLSQAIEQARSRGLLGKNILGTDFSCDLNIKIGAGAFVCGEETALIESMEGKRGMPRLKPPFPAQSGYLNEPSNINNVETFANVAWIIQHGGTAFAAMGTENSKGTKVFALTGKVQRGGLVEVPMGNSLKDVIFDIAGGIKDGRAYKAVQMGGPSGGCIPAALMDTPIDYKALSATGAIMGSGGMVVMDDSTCMVNIARFFLDFTARESCGKCVPCRIGTTRMMEILNRICEGEGQEGDIELLEELCVSIKDGALCGLGQTAPNPVLTTIRYFREEYEAHIRDKKCPAHECSALLTISIDPAKCTGCTVCARKCPVECISGTRKEPHVIDQSACIKCKQCVSSCKFGAIVVD